MQWNDTLQNALLVGVGAVALELFRYIRDTLNKALGRKRSELDRLAQELSLVTAEKDKQSTLKYQYLEMIWVLRGMMLRSGHWQPKDLPEEPKQ
jgi:hypothetical protein